MVAVQHHCNTIGLDKSAPLFVTTEVPFSSLFPCVLLFFVVPLVRTIKWKNDGVMHTPDEHISYDRHPLSAVGDV
jgi:hypothetical protein